jgi:thiamine-monophosphate kinase
MNLREIGEFGLIERIDRMIARGQRSLPNDLIIGIGDDAAVWKNDFHTVTVSTVDTLVEGIHFTREFSSWQDVGWKALAVNLSDVAAMGADPRWALVALSLPDRMPFDDVRRLYQGLIACARRYRTHLVGGNITKSPGSLVVSVTVTGSVKPRRLWRRDGARIGDVIAVTGHLGEAAAGLAALKKNTSVPSAVRRYRRPIPRLDAARRLQKAGITVHAAIDLSDGLAGDLRHVCKASRTGARVDLDVLPVTPSTVRLARRFNVPLDRWSLGGGEDYELLLTMTEKDFNKALKLFRKKLTPIGIVTPGRDIRFYRNGRPTGICIAGFRHF